MTITKDIRSFLQEFLTMSDKDRHTLLRKIFSSGTFIPVRHCDIDLETKQFLAAGKTQRMDYIRSRLELSSDWQ